MRLFERALDADPENLTARLNLATQLVTHPAPGIERSAYERQLSEALTHLNHVEDATDGYDGSAVDPCDLMIRFRALYIRAIANLAIESPSSLVASTRDLDRIRSATEKEVASTDTGALLKRMKLPVAMVRYSVELKSGEAAQQPPTPRVDDWITADSEYAMACAWAAYADTGDTAERGERETVALGHLRRAIKRRSGFKEIARGDWSLKPLAANEEFIALFKEEPEKDPKPQQLAVSLKLDKATRSLLWWSPTSQNGKKPGKKSRQSSK